MSTMEAISLTAAPANASEIALGEDVHPEERRQLQDLGLPLTRGWPRSLDANSADAPPSIA